MDDPIDLIEISRDFKEIFWMESRYGIPPNPISIIFKFCYNIYPMWILFKLVTF